MKHWTTEIKAIDPNDGQLKTWCGPNIPAITLEDAYNYRDRNGLGYCIITGELIAEIPCIENSYEPDFTKMINFENLN